MILFKFIPSIFTRKGRREFYADHVSGKKLGEYLKDRGLQTNGIRASVSGRIVDTNYVPDDGDVCVACVHYGDENARAAVATIVGLVVPQFRALTQLIATGYSIYLALTRKPEDDLDNETKGFEFRGGATKQEVGIPIPIVFGEHKVGGNIINMDLSARKALSYNPVTVATGDITELTPGSNPITGGFQLGTQSEQIVVQFPTTYSSMRENTYSSGAADVTEHYWPKYKVEYRVTGDPSWITAIESIGGELRRRVREYDPDTIETEYFTQRTVFEVVLSDLDYDLYDVRFTRLDSITSDISWDAIYNVTEVNQPVRSGDSQVKMLLALCEGEIEDINDVRINNIPIRQVKGARMYRRFGTNSQSSIPHFNDIHTEYEIDYQLVKDTGYEYTTYGSNVGAFEVQLTFPNGLYMVNKDGKQMTWTQTFTVEVDTGGGYSTYMTQSIQKNTRAAFTTTLRIEGITPGQFDIRITKTTDNSWQDDDTSKEYQGDVFLTTIDEIQLNDLSYPNTALLGVNVIANEAVSGGIPQVSAIVRGTKVDVPNILYSGTYVPWDQYYWDDANSQWKSKGLPGVADDTVLSWDGTTYVEKWTANPVWCIRWLLVNERFGLGEYIDTTHISDADWLEAAKWCEELVDDGRGDYEKRMRLDCVIDSPGRALDVVFQLCQSVRAFAFFTSGSVVMHVDKAETSSQLFGMGNIVAGSFEQSWKPIKDTPNIVKAEFFDSENDYQLETVLVADEDSLSAGDPTREMTLRLYCTRFSQAYREARNALNVAKYIERAASWRCGPDAVACQPGDVVDVSHDVPQWGLSGRVVSGTTSSVTIDQSVTLDGVSTYKVMVRFADDSIEERTVSNGAGTYTTLNVSSNFTQAPAAYDVYAFGVDGSVKKSFRILDIKRAMIGEIDITGIEYNASVYDDTAPMMPERNSMLQLEVPDVVGLSINERLAIDHDGTIINVIDVWFNKPSDNSYYLKRYAGANIFISDDSGDTWELRGSTQEDHFSIVGGVRTGETYIVAVASYTDGLESNNPDESPQDTITIAGKAAPPNDVANFSVIRDGDDIVMTWTPNPDLDLDYYEIREGDSWDRGGIVVTNLKSTNYRQPIFSFGAKRYMIKAVDTSGNYSQTEAYQVYTIADAPNIVFVLDTDLDDWDMGRNVGSDENDDELVIVANGDQVVDSNPNDVIVEDPVGFERLVTDEELEVIDSGGAQLTDGYGDVVLVPGTVEAYLSLREVSTGVYAREGIFRSSIGDITEVLSGRISVWVNIEGSDCEWDVYVRTSEDNVTWTSWALCGQGEYTFRFYEIEIRVRTNDTSIGAKLWNTKGRVTVRQIHDSGQDVSVSTSLYIAFNKTFYHEVAVFPMAEAVDRYCRFIKDGLDGFTVYVYDNAGVAADGDVDWIARGY